MIRYINNHIEMIPKSKRLNIQSLIYSNKLQDGVNAMSQSINFIREKNLRRNIKY